MYISIGIMLWNEEDSIAATIDSLFKQTLLSESLPGVEQVEVVALANGCTDNSVANAEAAFARNLAENSLPCVTASVIELPKGRQPAWNQFVHELTGPETDYIFFMDADIIIIDPNAFEEMVFGLENNPDKHVATSNAIKDIELAERRTLWQKFTLAMSRMERDARFFHVTGGLYCGRTSFFRKLEFPRGFVCGDDGFIGRLAVSNLQTTDFEWDRIFYLDKPTFVFEAYLSPARLFRQHRRRLVGGIVNRMIRDYISERQSDGKPDAGTILRQECRDNPEWLNQYVAEQIRQRGFWVVPITIMANRFWQLRRLPLWKKLLRLPLAVAGAAWNLGVIIAANRMFHKGTYIAAWENMPNTKTLDSQVRLSQPRVASDTRIDDNQQA